MIHLTAKNFQIETRQSSLPVVVMFYANWCGKCAMMKPIAEELEKKYSNQIRFCEVDVDESAVLAGEYAPDLVPTFILFKDQKIVGSLSGLIDEDVLDERIQKIFRNC